MNPHEILIYEQILNSRDIEKHVTYFIGPNGNNLPHIIEIWSHKIGYKYTQTIIYEPIYNNGILINYPIVDDIETLEVL